MLTIKEHAQDFANLIQPFGYMDLERALEILEDLKNIDKEQFDKHFMEYQNSILLSGILYGILEDESESLDMQIKDLDPVYSVLSYILQMARNKIDKLINYDIQNSEDCNYRFIEVYGNYLDSSFEYSEEAKASLREKIEASDKTKEELEENIFIAYLFQEMNL